MNTVTATHLNPRRGFSWVRFLIALARANNDIINAIAITQSQNWRDTPEVVQALKAAVGALDTEDAEALLRPIWVDYAEALRPLSILGRLQGLHSVPFNTRLNRQSLGTSAYWVGETNPKPMTRAEFEGETLLPAKVASMVAETKELIQLSRPSAEVVISRDLRRAGAQALDVAFIDPDNAGTVNVKPASVTYGEPQFPSTGATVGNIDEDLALLINSLSDAGSDLALAAWVMRPRTAIYLSRLRGTSDNAPSYPFINAKGGTLMGLPVITSANVPVSAETGNPSSIILLDPSQIAVADDGDSDLSVTTQATVQMETDPQTGATEQVSLWQCGLIGLRAERMVNWRRRHPGMAATLTSVTY